MSKTQVYNYLQIAAVLMIGLMALMFNTNDKVNLQPAIIFEMMIVAVTVIWRIAFSEEIKMGE